RRTGFACVVPAFALRRPAGEGKKYQFALPCLCPVERERIPRFSSPRYWRRTRAWRSRRAASALPECHLDAVMHGLGRSCPLLSRGRSFRSSGDAGNFWLGRVGKSGLRDSGGWHSRQLHGQDYFARSGIVGGGGDARIPGPHHRSRLLADPATTGGAAPAAGGGGVLAARGGGRVCF